MPWQNNSSETTERFLLSKVSPQVSLTPIPSLHPFVLRSTKSWCTVVPTAEPLKDGDIVSIDCGTFLNGFCGDSAYTFCVGEVSDEVKRLLRTTKESLYKGIEAALPITA